MTNSQKRERGVAVVEFALVLPLLVTVLFGAIDFGFVSSDTTKLRQAVRETGRRASVWRFGRSICDDNIAGEYKRGKLVGNHGLGSSVPLVKPDNSTGDSRLTEARKVQCQLRLLALEAGLDVRTKVLVAESLAVHTGLEAPAAPHSGALDKENADPNPPPDPATGMVPDLRDMSFTVVICAQYRTKSRTGFFGPLLNHKILRSTVAMRIARLNVTPTPFYPGAVEEEPFTVNGQPGNWDGCAASGA
jgi:TadE-like protein